MSVPGPGRPEAPEARPAGPSLPAPFAPGTFITFEGLEGTGKSTQLELLARQWSEQGADVVATKEPGGTELGRALRALLLKPTDQPMCPEAELLAYVADRAQHLTEVIEPALERGAVVLCDRYVDATLAYQGYGRGLDIGWIRDLHRQSPLNRVPHRTLLLDLDPEPALARANRRNAELNLATSEGRFEQERLDFHRRVRAGYLDLAAAEPQRIRIVNAGGEVAEVTERLKRALDDLVPPAGKAPC